MAIPFLVDIDLNLNELKNAKIHKLAAAPSSPAEAQIYYNTTDKKYYGWNSTVWIDLSPVFSNKAILDTITAAYTTAEKTKLSGIATGAQANQNAFSNVLVGGTTVAADAATDTIELVAGQNILLTPDATNDKVTIATTGLGNAAAKNTGTTNGTIPLIGADNKLDQSILPALAITDTFVVATEAAMLAVAAQVGDVAVRTDLKKSFILKTSPATTLVNWQELLTPTDVVTSVAGKTGVVTLNKSDVGLGNVDNTSDASKPVSTAVQTALDSKVGKDRAISAGAGLTGGGYLDVNREISIWEATQEEAETGTVQYKTMTPLRTKQSIIANAPVKSVAGKTDTVTLTKADVGLGSVDNTTDVNKPISTATQTALNAKAPLASPALTGTPTAPTAAVAMNNTQIATTAFVKNQNYVPGTRTILAGDGLVGGGNLQGSVDLAVDFANDEEAEDGSSMNKVVSPWTAQMAAMGLLTSLGMKIVTWQTNLIGNGTATVFEITHTFNTFPLVQIVRNGGAWDIVYPDIRFTETGGVSKVVIDFGVTVPTLQQYLCVLVGERNL